MEIIDNLEFEKDNLPEDYYEKNLEGPIINNIES